MNAPTKLSLRLILIIILLSSAARLTFGQGKLGRIRDAVRESNPASHASSEHHHDSGSHAHEEDHDRRNRNHNGRLRNHRRRGNRCGSGVGFVLGNVFGPPVQEVHVVHHQPVAPVLVPAPVVAPAPILESQQVYESVVGSDIGHEVDYERSFVDWGMRLTVVGGTDFDDISQGGIGLLLQSPGSLGLDTSVTMLRESGMSFRDHLYLGDVNVVYEPLITNNFRLRVGIGVNWLGDSYGGDAGFNMTSGFDWKLTERHLISGEIDLGTLGDTDLTHAELGIGTRIGDTAEWVVGYDYHDIGGVTIGSAVTGLRFRF